MTRVSVPAMDALIGHKFPVLDDGFVCLVDYMGSDEAIVQAARVSYGTGTKKTSEDRDLLRYLMRHRHTSPFEMCELKLHVRVPMDCWRQWIRHRMASVNEYSTRYSEAIDSQQKTAPQEWRAQSQANKQGSGECVTEWPTELNRSMVLGISGLAEGTSPGAYLSNREAAVHLNARRLYEERLQFGVAREQARKDLPLSTYTEAYWKIDLHNLLHFLGLRMDSHAQLEIRSYANIIGNEIVAKWCPLAWQAFQDYRLGAMTLSGPEIAAFTASLMDLRSHEEVWQEHGLSKRETTELYAKLVRLQLAVAPDQPLRGVTGVKIQGE